MFKKRKTAIILLLFLFVLNIFSAQDIESDYIFDNLFISGGIMQDNLSGIAINISDGMVLARKENIAGYIIEFDDPSIIEKQIELDSIADYNEQIIKESGNFNPKKYAYQLFSTRKRDVNELVEEYKKDIKPKRESIKEKIKIKLNKKEIDIKEEYENVFNGISLKISKEEAQKLKGMEGIKEVYPDIEVNAELMNAVPLVGGNYSWINGFTGKNITIAIIDTGIDYTHADLGGCFGVNCKVVGGYDFVNKDNNPMDDHGHGTHCAGIAAGNGALKGVAKDAKLYAYKVLNSAGSGYSSNIIAAINKVVDPNGDGNYSDHLDIISMSLGANCGVYSLGCGPDDAQSKAVDNAVKAGVVVVISAGNNGPTESSIGSPGTARNAITVGAVDKNKVLASFSSRGPVNWNGTIINKPDVVAPGVSICSAEYDSAWISYRCLDDKHVAISGTSMATPIVAGAAAIMLEKNKNSKPLDIKQTLMLTANDLGYAINQQGGGLINLTRALALNGTYPISKIFTSGEIYSSELDIIGSANSLNYSNYSIYYIKESDYLAKKTSWQKLYDSNKQVNNSLLYHWNLSFVEENKYVVRLIARGNSLESTSYSTIDIINTRIDSPENYSILDSKKIVYINGTAKGYGFESYSLEWCDKDNNCQTSGFVLTNNGNTPIIKGQLGYWEVPTSAKSGDYIIKLINHYHYDVNAIKGVYVESDFLEGWPKNIPLVSPYAGWYSILLQQPTIADLNNDGTKEMIIAYGYKLYVFNYDGTDFAGFPRAIPYLAQRGPSVEDIDNDGNKEIIYADGNGYVNIYKNNGEVLAGWPKYYSRGLTLTSVADLDNDGNKEIVVSNFTGVIYAIKNNGQIMQGWPKILSLANGYPYFANFKNPLTIADVNGDGTKEIIANMFSCNDNSSCYYSTNSSMSLSVYDYQGNLLENWPKQYHLYMVGLVAADINNDKKQDLIFTQANKLHILDYLGNEIVQSPSIFSSSDQLGGISIGDIDENNNLDIVVGAKNSVSSKFCLYAFEYYNSELNLKSGFPVCNGDLIDGKTVIISSFDTPIYLGSLYSDIAQQIARPSSKIEGKYYVLQIMNYNGTVYTNKKLNSDFFNRDTMPIVDLNNDGSNELITYTWNGDIFVWTFKGNSTLADWPLYQHDEVHTGSIAYDMGDSIIITNKGITNLTAYTAVINIDTSIPTNLSVEIIKNNITALTRNFPLVSFNHSISIDGLEPSVKYSYKVIFSDEYNNKLIYNPNVYFRTRASARMPAMPTSFYGRVVSTSQEAVGDIEVSAKWIDVDNNTIISKTKSLNLQEAIALGNQSLVGYYLFNKGSVKAKTNSRIELSAPDDLNEIQPSILSNPGAKAFEVQDALILSGEPANITIISPENKEYLENEELYLMFNTTKSLKEARYKINNDAFINVIDKLNKNISIIPRGGINIINISIIDLMSIPNSVLVSFNFKDESSPNLTISNLLYYRDRIDISMQASDKYSYISNECFVCISQNFLCESFIKLNISQNLGKIASCYYSINKSYYSAGNYNVFFKMSDEFNNSAIKNTTIVIDTSLPGEVITTAKTIQGENALNVTWTKSSDSDFLEYRVYRSSSPEYLIKRINLVNQTSFKDNYLISGKTYGYRVKVVDKYFNENNGMQSNATVADTTIPVVVIINPIFGNVYNSKNINLEYYVNEATNCSYTLNGIVNPISSTQANISINDGMNSIQVMCFDGANRGYSQNITFYSDTTPPVPVSNINITQQKGELSLILNWQYNADAFKYRIYRSQARFVSLSSAILLAEVSGNSYYDAVNITENKTYYYAIIPIDSIGNQNINFTLKNFTIKEVTPPNIVIISPENILYNTSLIMLNYSANEAVKDCVYILDNKDKNASIGINLNVTSEGEHLIKVFCSDYFGNTGFSENRRFNLDLGAPKKINNLRIINNGQGFLDIYWNNSKEPDFKEYRLYRDVNNFSSVEGKLPLYTGTSPYYSDRTVFSGQTYYYAVSAVDIYGNENKEVMSVSYYFYVAPNSLFINITSPVNRYYNLNNISLAYISNKQIDACFYTSNNSSFDIGNDNTLIINANEGENFLYLNCTDIDNISASAFVRFYIDTIVPEAIEDLNIVQATNANTLYLTWEEYNNYDFNNYNVYRSSLSFNSTNNAILIGRTSNNSFKDENINPGQYYYAVTVLDKAGNENKSFNSVLANVVENDTQKPTVVVGSISQKVYGIVNLSSEVMDNKGLKKSCLVCISSDGICDSEYILAENSFNEGDLSGKCLYIWDTRLYEKRNYTYNFKVYDLSNNIGEGQAKFTNVVDAPVNLTCMDGTLVNFCSLTKPKLCINKSLIDNCTFCGCNSGYKCNINGSCSLIMTCSDGTKYNECSSTKPLFCNVSLYEKCSLCGCSNGTFCNITTNKCYNVSLPSPINLSCNDNTPEGSCSSTQPKLCINGSLVDNCITCGCSKDKYCNNSINSCLSIPNPIKTIYLYKGWNLISVPLKNSDMSISSILGHINESYNSIYSYNALTGQWQIYNSKQTLFDQASSLVKLDLGNAYWVDASEDIVFEVSGANYSNYSIDLQKGWNLVGYPINNEKSVESALESIKDKYDIIYTYDAENSLWEFYSPYSTEIYENSLETLEAGKGYWIYMYESAKWQI
ncbi:MAG: S8 family serine peptidase [Candidatus Nanoarchaeia archaeon]